MQAWLLLMQLLFSHHAREDNSYTHGNGKKVQETISTAQTGHRKTQKTNKTMHISPILEMLLAENFSLQERGLAMEQPA
jgi:hypothetical protein